MRGQNTSDESVLVQDLSPRCTYLSWLFRYFRSHLRPVKSFKVQHVATLKMLRSGRTQILRDRAKMNGDAHRRSNKFARLENELANDNLSNGCQPKVRHRFGNPDLGAIGTENVPAGLSTSY